MIYKRGRWEYGNKLDPVDQRYVLEAYRQRYTRDHKPEWVKRATWEGYPVQFASDQEWLANTQFRVLTRGRLDKRSTTCWSTPTWPDGPPSWKRQPKQKTYQEGPDHAGLRRHDALGLNDG